MWIPKEMLLTGKVERIKLGSVVIPGINAIFGNDHSQARHKEKIHSTQGNQIIEQCGKSKDTAPTT